MAIAGWRGRQRLRHETGSGVTDEIVQKIETLDRVDAEDVAPLDPEQARTGGGRGLDLTNATRLPAKLPLFDLVFPLFEHDGRDHGLAARNADRAVLVRLRRFLAGIRVPSQEIIRRAL